MKTTLREVTERTLKPGSAVLPRKPVSAAWLRTVLDHTSRSYLTRDGWNVLEMKLDPGEGSMHVRTRREGDRIAVSVGFSDASMRHLAGQHLDRLQDTLRQMYDQPVDFSFSDSGGDPEQGRQAHQGARSGSREGPLTPAPSTTESIPLRTAGATHVWVG